MKKELEYTIVDSFELETMDTHLYGRAPTAGRNDRVGYILEVEDGKCFIVYDECWYHYSCTENRAGYNIVEIDDVHFIKVDSETDDYSFTIFKSLEDAKNYVYEWEDYGYVVR
jgi:hypothetical protein